MPASSGRHACPASTWGLHLRESSFVPARVLQVERALAQLSVAINVVDELLLENSVCAFFLCARLETFQYLTFAMLFSVFVAAICCTMLHATSAALLLAQHFLKVEF
eukprot:TRINITY_DN11111_c0_g1_i1.p2 TRINITY_DN11111_c0_g1~~TRINITY_DN11111_c0_g1_i1.p2  ORF type:complete len:107 (+),score=6.54 TRINITY_DN11111_c0_g1_i1:295-615(+)